MNSVKRKRNSKENAFWIINNGNNSCFIDDSFLYHLYFSLKNKTILWKKNALGLTAEKKRGIMEGGIKIPEKGEGS